MLEYGLHLFKMMLAADAVILGVWLFCRFAGNTGYLWRKWLWLFVSLLLLFPQELYLSSFSDSWKEISVELSFPKKSSVREEIGSKETETIAIRENGNRKEEKKTDGNGTELPALPEQNQAERIPQSAENVSKKAPEKTGLYPLGHFVKTHAVELLLLLWLAGFVGMVFYHMLQYYLMKDRYLADAEKCTDEQLLLMEEELGKQYKIRKLPALMEKENLKTPLVFGYFRVTLIVPPKGYSAEELSMILRHELIHKKYGDMWYKLLIMLVCDLYWFNPVLRIMKSMAFQDVEYVCDERVVDSIRPEEIQVYGETILKTMKISRKREASPALHFAASKKSLKNRLGHLFAERHLKRQLLLFLIVVGISLFLMIGIKISVAEAPEVRQENSFGKMYQENHFYNQAVVRYGDFIYYLTASGIMRTTDCVEYEQVYQFSYPARGQLWLEKNRLYFSECKNEEASVKRETGIVYLPDTLMCMDLDTLEAAECLNGIRMLNNIRVFQDQLYFADGEGNISGFLLDEDGIPKAELDRKDPEFLYKLDQNAGFRALVDEGYCRILMDGKVFAEKYADEATMECSLTDTENFSWQPFGVNCEKTLLTESGFYFVPMENITYREICYRDHETGEVLTLCELPKLDLDDECNFLTYNEDSLFFALYQKNEQGGTSTILDISREDGRIREIYKTCSRESFVYFPEASAFKNYLYVRKDASEILRIHLEKRSKKILEGGIPSKESVLEKREEVLGGVSPETRESLRGVISGARKKLFSLYYEENLFGKLEDPDSRYWKIFEQTGEIRQEDQTFLFSRYRGQDFIERIQMLCRQIPSEELAGELEILERDMKAALASHNHLYVEDLYDRLHDLDFYLLQYGPEDGWISGIDNYDLFLYYGTLELYR